MSRYQKGKTNLDFTEARDSEWQWHQLGCMQVCTLLQTDNHASTSPLSFLQAGCPSCLPTNSIKALKATHSTPKNIYLIRLQADTPTVSRYAVGDNKGDIAVAQKACLNSDMRHAGHLCALLYRQVGMQTGRQLSSQ